MITISKIEVARVIPLKTPKKGLYAGVSLQLLDDSKNVFMTLNDMKLCKNRDGDWYLSPPYRPYENREGQKGKSYYYYLSSLGKEGDPTFKKGLLDKVLENFRKAGGDVNAPPDGGASPQPVSQEQEELF